MATDLVVAQTYVDLADRMAAMAHEIDALLTERAALVASLREFVRLYDDGTRTLIGPVVTGMLGRADALLEKVEGR